jgi:hypothetical protein
MVTQKAGRLVIREAAILAHGVARDVCGHNRVRELALIEIARDYAHAAQIKFRLAHVNFRGAEPPRRRQLRHRGSDDQVIEHAAVLEAQSLAVQAGGRGGTAEHERLWLRVDDLPPRRGNGVMGFVCDQEAELADIAAACGLHRGNLDAGFGGWFGAGGNDAGGIDAGLAQLREGLPYQLPPMDYDQRPRVPRQRQPRCLGEDHRLAGGGRQREQRCPVPGAVALAQAV